MAHLTWAWHFLPLAGVSWHSSPPTPRNIGTSTIPSESPFGGRPKYDLDLGEALRFHDLENSWEGKAEAMGVTRWTMYNHMDRAGFSTDHRSFMEISDDELDEHVSAISLCWVCHNLRSFRSIWHSIAFRRCAGLPEASGCIRGACSVNSITIFP